MKDRLKSAPALVPRAAKLARRTHWLEHNPRVSSSPTTPARPMEPTRSTRSICSTTRTGASSSAPSSPSPSVSSAGRSTSTLPGRTTSPASSSPPQSSPSPCPSSGQEPHHTASSVGWLEEAEWDKTRDIDNPLSPWVTKYKGELNLDDGENFHDRPPLEIVIRKFRTAKFTAYTAAVLFTVFFMGLWPGSMLTVDILDLAGFNIWTTISRGWAFTAAAVIVILPLYQEVSAILKQLKKNKKEGRMLDDNKSQNEALMQPLQQKSHSIDSRPIIKSSMGYKIINKHLDLTANNCSLSNSSSSSSISPTADSKSSSTPSLVNAQ